MTKNKVETEVTPGSKQQEDSPLPAYFLSLTVENVRCFGPRQTLDMLDGKGRPAQWTIILGNNGVGKTTLLRSFVAVTPIVFPALTEQEGQEHVIARFFIDQKMNSEWEPYRYGKGNDNYYFSADFSVDAKLLDSKIGEVLVDFHVGRNENSSHLFSKRANSIPKKHLAEIACFGYGASRRMGDTTLSEKAEDYPFASLFSDNVPLLNAEEWLLQADYAAHAGNNATARKRAAERRDEIKEILLNILPEVDDIKFTPITEEQTKPGVEVKTPYGWVSIKDLSLGYKTLIAWMVDFASRMFERYPNSANPLAEPAVVLVDEIDLHLHPKWQRVLMSYLSERFPNTQFIATAHSPLVVQAAADANVVLLRREGDHVVIDNDVKDIHGWRVDQILTSDLFGLESAPAAAVG